MSATSVIYPEIEKSLRFRVFNKRNIHRFKELIGDVQWHNVYYTHDDVKLAYQSFVVSFNSVFNRFFPLVSMHTKRGLKLVCIRN